MVRSIANGDYRVLNAVESGSRPGEWYAVVSDRRTTALSCDCPPWTFNRNGDRTCKHTLATQRLLSPGTTAVSAPATTDGNAAGEHPFISAARQQWPGLLRRWHIEQGTATVDGDRYTVVLLRLETGNGEQVTGVASFADRHRHTPETMAAWVAAWCGYAIAAELAYRGGHRLGALPPRRATLPRVAGAGTRRRARAAPQVTFGDILRVGDVRDLGDGLLPEQRAENTLRLFLGDELYTRLDRQGFLDVSSVLYPQDERVYRLRRHAHKRHEHRVRVFERGAYVRDLCIVRAQNVPEADWFLTVFLGLLSDERATLSVVRSHNIFPRYSDDRTGETLPALWQARETALPPAS
jgi:hypothetical protein